MSTHPANVNQPQVRVFSLDEPEEPKPSSAYKPFFEQAKELPQGQGLEIAYATRYRALLAAQAIRSLIRISGEPLKISQKNTKVKIWKV